MPALRQKRVRLSLRAVQKITARILTGGYYFSYSCLFSFRSTYRADGRASAALDAGICINYIFIDTGRDRGHGALGLASTAGHALITNLVCHDLLHLLEFVILLYHIFAKSQSFSRFFSSRASFSSVRFLPSRRVRTSSRR